MQGVVGRYMCENETKMVTGKRMVIDFLFVGLRNELASDFDSGIRRNQTTGLNMKENFNVTQS